MIRFHFHISAQAKKKVRSVVHQERLVAFVKENKDARVSDMEARRIVSACLKTSDPLFYLSLINTESTYYPRAVSKVGARGLGQVMPNIHYKSLKRAGIIATKDDLFNIEKNVAATEHVYTNMLEDAGGSHKKALAKYLGCRSDRYYKKTMDTYQQLRQMVGVI